MQYSSLFSPIRLGGVEIKNRIALAPMGTGNYNDDETVSAKYIDFIKARTEATGLIITTGCRVSSKYGKLKFFGCYSDSQINGLKKLSDAAHANGAKIFLQILALGGSDPEEPYVPSINVPNFKENWTSAVKPVELDKSQVEELIQDFIEAALRARMAGFDGVELFGAEEGIISEFITPYFNRRTDDYGGNFENLMRFPVEIIKGIKKLCGSGFPVGFKFNAFYDIENGIDLDYGVRIAKKIAEYGADYIHEWSFASLAIPMSLFKYPPMPNLYQQRNSTIPIAKNLKSSLKDVPIMAVCGILKPDEADSIIGEGFADMVAIGRGYIAENDWALKAQNNLNLRPCIRCHVCHHEVAILGKEIVCSINPDVFGYKKEYEKSKYPSRNVMVIGGGPGGIISAITASKRGHSVTLYEKESRLGGKLIQGSIPDFKHEFKDFLNYLRTEISCTDVKIVMDTEVNAEMLKRENPDSLVIAIGAKPVFPAIVDGKNLKIKVITAIEALQNLASYNDLKIVVLGGGDVGCETALSLKLRGNDVSIIEYLGELMKNDEIKHNTAVLEKMLRENEVNIFVSSEIIEIGTNLVNFRNLTSGIINRIGADLIVVAAGYKEPVQQVNEFKLLCKNSFALGDCSKNDGRLRNAINEGYRVALQI